MATRVTSDPATDQTEPESELKATAKAEEAVALIVNGAVPSVWFASAPKVMVWLSGAT
jgi:hypothetical protein